MRYTFVIIAFMVSFVLCSCSEDAESIRKVVFHVSVTVPIEEGKSPVVTITHNGTNRDEYCGLLVEDTLSDIEQIINEYVSKNDDIPLLSQKKKVITLYSLAPNKTYTFVVFGITSKNMRYGQPASTKFRIPGEIFTATINPNWKVNYRGKLLYEGNYYSMTTVDVDKSSTEQYFVYEYEPTFVSRFSSMEDFLYHATNDYHERLRTDDTNAFWKEDNQLHTESISHYFHLGSGEYSDRQKKYLSFAIGLNSEGKPTGHYARSDTFELGEYPYLASYLYIVGGVVGKWKAVSEDGKIQLNARLSNKVANETIKAGWEEFGITKYFTIRYNPYNASLMINDEQVDANYQRIDGKSVHGKTYMKAWYLNNLGDTLLSSSTELAYGILQQDGTYLFRSMIENDKTGLIFAFYTDDGRILLNQNTSITLPFTLSKQN